MKNLVKMDKLIMSHLKKFICTGGKMDDASKFQLEGKILQKRRKFKYGRILDNKKLKFQYGLNTYI